MMGFGKCFLDFLPPPPCHAQKSCFWGVLSPDPPRERMSKMEALKPINVHMYSAFVWNHCCSQCSSFRRSGGHGACLIRRRGSRQRNCAGRHKSCGEIFYRAHQCTCRVVGHGVKECLEQSIHWVLLSSALCYLDPGREPNMNYERDITIILACCKTMKQKRRLCVRAFYRPT